MQRQVKKQCNAFRLYLLIPIVCFMYVVFWCTFYLEGMKVQNHSRKSWRNEGGREKKNRQLLRPFIEIGKDFIANAMNGNKGIKGGDGVTGGVIRAAVVIYIPSDINFVTQFVTMLYGSWKYVNINRVNIFNRDVRNANKINTVDLVVFAHERVFKVLPDDCHSYYTASGDPWKGGPEPTCLKIQQDHETDSEYKSLNSYIMFFRSDISKILDPYTFVLRTDMDVFLTPKFFTYRPTVRIVSGFGAYCHDFNRGRLKEISKRLGMKHNGVHCVGSSWYGYTKDITELSRKASNVSRYLYENEFKNGLRGLEKFDFTAKPNGVWPDWYRLTSTMYGSEIALNDGVSDFSYNNMKKFDTSTCNLWNITDHYQLHAYHTECEFNKIRFLNTMTEYLIGTSPRRQMLWNKLTAYSKMTLTDIEHVNATVYSTFIAWHSAAKYLEHKLLRT